MNPKEIEELTPMLSGVKYRRTHKASVMSILGDETPNVVSRGSLFFNLDRWTLRWLVKPMAEWAKANPGCVPTKKDVAQWVNWANTQSTPHREIVIANTPDKLPVRTAMALTGGAYHEAFHTKYSCRRPLQADEVAKIILPRWAQVKDWSCLTVALLEWMNVVEDIRIERRGRQDFEGTYIKLCDLQDLILSMEAKGLADARAHSSKAKESPLSIIIRTFRDCGLAYNTEIQRDALESYKKTNLQAYELVTKGPLRSLMDASVRLHAKDDIGCLRVAMDVLVALGDLADKNESDQENKQQGPGDGETKCPACGADGDKLVVRPKSDGHGGKVKGKGIVTCTVCGWQQEIDIQIKKQQPGQSQGQKSKSKQPRMEGFDESDVTESDGQEGQSGQGQQSGKPKSGKGGDQKQQSGSGQDQGDDEGDGQSGGSGQKGKDKKGPAGGGGQDGDDTADGGDQENGQSGGKSGKDKKQSGGSGDQDAGDGDDGDQDGKKSGKGQEGEDGEGSGKKKGKDKDGAGEEDGEGEGGSGGKDGEGDDGDQDGEGSGDDGDKDGQGGKDKKDKGKGGEKDGDGDGDKEDGDGDGEGEEDGDGQGGQSPDNPEIDKGGSPGGAGGHFYNDQPLEGQDWSEVAEAAFLEAESEKAAGHFYNDQPLEGQDWSEVAEAAFLEAESEKAAGLQDANSALEQGFAEAQAKDDKDVEKNEALWKPYDAGLDTVEPIPPSTHGKEYDRAQADNLLKSVKEETAYLRARLRSVIHSFEMVSHFHGVPKGRQLSNRFLVDSKVALMGKQDPTKAYVKKGIQMDMTMAAAAVIDESGSMHSLRRDATRMLCAITEPLDGLGCPVLAIGFRDGQGGYRPYRYGQNNDPHTPDEEYDRGYHRFDGVHIDVFKGWNEKFKGVKWRFANTQANGGTPMADGIQFALQGLSLRDEAHRFLFVITDGCPNGGHAEIIRRQIRLGKEAGVHIIGVGIGHGAQYVQTLFEDSVYSDTVKEIPKMLVAKLNELADIRGGKRGKRVKKD